MLWPEKRARDPILGGHGVGDIARTTQTSWLTVPRGFLPDSLVALRGPFNWILPGSLTEAGDLQLGPIPKGTPVGLLGNFDPMPQEPGLVAGATHVWKLLRFGLRLRHDLVAMPKDADTGKAIEIFTPMARELYELSVCPDYVVNRGHYFGTDRLAAEEPGLSDPDKRALIEFLKTF